MDWKIAKAKQEFSRLVRSAAEEPQRIFNRDRLVAAMVSPRALEQLEVAKQRQKRSLAEVFAELRQLCAEEDYVFEEPKREDRPNAFAEVLDELSR